MSPWAARQINPWYDATWPSDLGSLLVSGWPPPQQLHIHDKDTPTTCTKLVSLSELRRVPPPTCVTPSCTPPPFPPCPDYEVDFIDAFTKVANLGAKFDDKAYLFPLPIGPLKL